MRIIIPWLCHYLPPLIRDDETCIQIKMNRQISRIQN